MAAGSSKKHCGDRLEMTPEQAKTLFDHGGVLIIQDLPVGSIFGIDMKVNQVGDKFRGMKMIPPGLHYIYYSAVSKEGSVAPRAGFFHFFSTQEVLVKKWNTTEEDLQTVEASDEELQRIRHNLQDLDQNLGPYPYQILNDWNRLTCNISDSLMKKLQPLSGVVRSVTELIPVPYPAKESSEPDSTTEKRHQTLEEKYLPEMKQVPGTEIRFTAIPTVKHPAGCSASQITLHNMDSTYILEQLLASYEKEEDILGELQMAHVCFLIAHVYDAFEHWKKLVSVMCSVDSGIERHSSILMTFLTMLHYQLKEIPSDFFVDITANDNFLVTTLQIFFENVKSSGADNNFKKFANRFRKNLTSIYKWDFESVPDDEQPVVVVL